MSLSAIAFGEKVIGRITYDKAGRMSGQMMRLGRHPTLPPEGALLRATPARKRIREVVSGFIAYFGTFDVDEPAQTVSHHIQACLIPSWVGTDQSARIDSIPTVYY